LIKYFYKNINSPYEVLNSSIPRSRSEILNKTSKLSNEEKIVKNSNFRNIEFVGVSGSAYFQKLPKGNNAGELLTDGKNSVYVCRHIIRNGDRQQSFRRSPDPMMEVFYKNKELFSNFDVDVNRGIIADGCFKTNKTILQRTMVPDTESFLNGLPNMSTIKLFKKTIKSTIRKLKIPVLAPADKDDMKFSRFDKNTYPGFFYKEYLNLSTKEKASPYALEIANEKWDCIEKCNNNKKTFLRNELFPGTYTVGARNKRDLTYEDFDVLSSRAVHMPEFHNELHSSVWTDPISNYIRDLKRGPIYIGNSFIDFQRMYKDMGVCSTILEGDVKRFDSRVWLNLIIIAVSLSRLYYPLDDESIDNHFIAIFDTIAIKDYYTPGGYIYRMIHGIPSGVKSTTLYGSFINLVMQSFFNEGFESKKINYCIGGDDFLVGYKFSIDDNVISNIEQKAIDCGWELKYLSRKSFSSPDVEGKPYFYKYTIDRGEPIISMTTLLERSFLPWNKKYNNFSEIFNFLLDIIPSLAAPRSHFLIFYELCSYVKKRYLKINSPPSYFYNLHKNIYDKVMRGELLLTSRNRKEHACYSIIECNVVTEGYAELNKFFFDKKLYKVSFNLK
jgi:hypothetical protein